MAKLNCKKCKKTQRHYATCDHVARLITKLVREAKENGKYLTMSSLLDELVTQEHESVFNGPQK